MKKQQSNLFQLFLLLSAVCLVLFWSDRNRYLDPVRGFFEEKILRVRFQHNEELQNIIYEKDATIVSLTHDKEELTKENIDLRKQLESPLPPTFSFIPARVVVTTISEEDTSMLVAAGRIEGVSEKMPVVYESILIGIVTSVTPHTATVRLLSSPKSKVAVISQSSQGIVIGRSGQMKEAVIDRVLQTETLTVDASIVTSGEDDIPANLLVGKITKITSEARDPFQKATIMLTVDPSILSRVYLVNQ